MKHIMIFFIKVYQKIPGPWHSMCRHYPTCSEYSKEAFERYGFFKGFYLSIKRILRCSPWGTYGYDPVPDLRRKK